MNKNFEQAEEGGPHECYYYRTDHKMFLCYEDAREHQLVLVISDDEYKFYKDLEVNFCMFCGFKSRKRDVEQEKTIEEEWPTKQPKTGGMKWIHCLKKR